MKTCALILSLLLILASCPAWAEGELVTGPDRRHEIDLRIEALDARRAEISTTGPKTSTFIGLGAMVMGGIALGVGISCPPGYACEEFYARSPGAAIAGAVLIGIGAVTAITGGIIWNARADRRNELDAERDSLIEQRDGMAGALSTLQIGSEYRDDTHFVKIGFRF